MISYKIHHDEYTSQTIFCKVAHFLTMETKFDLKTLIVEVTHTYRVHQKYRNPGLTRKYEVFEKNVLAKNFRVWKEDSDGDVDDLRSFNRFCSKLLFKFPANWLI